LAVPVRGTDDATGRRHRWRFLVIPPFAAWWGLPAYLVLGLPLFWLTIKNCPEAIARHEYSPFIIAGFVANLATYPFYLVGMESMGMRSAEEWALFCFGFGLVFAPLHGLVFGALYSGWMESGSRGTRAHVTEIFTAS